MFLQSWKVSEKEIVRIGNCQTRKLSEQEIVRWESVRIRKCQNWKVSELRTQSTVAYNNNPLWNTIHSGLQSTYYYRQCSTQEGLGASKLYTNNLPPLRSLHAVTLVN